MNYQPRLLDRVIDNRLKFSGAVLLEGTRGCGKTETARRHATAEILFDVDNNAREVADTAPDALLDPPWPKLLDEWQLTPQIWNVLRRRIDQDGAHGRYLLTGSSTPDDDPARHSGAGRIARLRLRTLTTNELFTPTTTVSLADLIDGKATATSGPKINLDAILEQIVRGSWPGSRHLSLDQALTWMRDYVTELTHNQVKELLDLGFSPSRLAAMLASLARNLGTRVTNLTLAEDMSVTLGESVRPEAVTKYLHALTRLLVFEPLPAWPTHLRSKSRLRSQPVATLVDPALAVAALGADPDFLLADLNYTGLLFEGLVLRDFRVYAQCHQGEVFQYRDSNNLEVDMIVQLGAKRWGAFEVKLSGQATVLDEAAHNLKRFAANIDIEKMGPPGCLAIVSGLATYAYPRPDGIWVLPYRVLGP